MLFKDYFAGIVGSGRTGDCLIFDSHNSAFLGAFAYSDVPPEWQPIYFEYIKLLDGAAYVVIPLRDLCNAGGGTVDSPTVQRILGYIDPAQLRMYELTQQAQTIP